MIQCVNQIVVVFFGILVKYLTPPPPPLLDAILLKNANNLHRSCAEQGIKSGSRRGISLPGEGVQSIYLVNFVDLRNLKFPNHPFLFAHADFNATNILGHVQLLYVKLTI